MSHNKDYCFFIEFYSEKFLRDFHNTIKTMSELSHFLNPETNIFSTNMLYASLANFVCNLINMQTESFDETKMHMDEFKAGMDHWLKGAIKQSEKDTQIKGH